MGFIVPIAQVCSSENEQSFHCPKMLPLFALAASTGTKGWGGRCTTPVIVERPAGLRKVNVPTEVERATILPEGTRPGVTRVAICRRRAVFVLL